jgi:chromate reductase
MATIKKKILAISGSTRTGSVNEAILKFIAKEYSEVLEVDIFKSIAALPHFNPDINDEDTPGIVRKFRESIAQSDGVIICTPEYVFSLPGALKNAIEWTVSTTVFSGKPVAFIVASGLGEKAYESLLLIMNTIEAKIGAHASILLKGARSKFNDQGQLSDESTLKDIEKLVDSFLETIDNPTA